MSDYHRSRFAYDARRDAVWAAIVAYLVRTKVIEPGWDVIDLGAGYCHLINNLPARRRFALDTLADLASYAGPGVVPLVQQCHDPWPIEDASLQAVFASNLLEHLTRPQLDLVAAEMRRVLKPGGRVIVLQPNYYYAYREYFDDYTHVAVFSHVSLADYFMAQSLTPIRIVPRLLPFSMKTPAPKSRWLVDLYLRSPIRPFGKQMLIVCEKPR